MKFIRIASILLPVALLVACNSGADRRYLDASMDRSLELPPDLSEFDEESKFELPAGISGAESSAKNKVPVLARVNSLRLEGSGDLYWLRVEEPIDNLYQLVKSFWYSEGYRLMVDEPVIGIMQTEWVITEQGPNDASNSWFKSLFVGENLSASQDQYRTRIELDQAGNASRIYIAHRGTELGYEVELGEGLKRIDNDDNQWRFRQPEPELEVEMLSRLMIFLGLKKAEVEQQVANVKLFRPRAFQRIDADQQSPYLIVKDPYQIAWNRVYHQLERMNFEIENSEFKRGLLGEGAITVKVPVTESKEGKGLFSFFSKSSETVEKKIVVVLAEVTHELTRVMIETRAGNADTSPAGAAFLDLLYKKIR
ncbi:MAG: outer membrane protein assembly factor BamC [Gammaproteobacteria bacterium]|nr:outer membrane protein assembly factor BamC [Gammaproteobacteria bacterium]